jgi:hypothetical protein
MPSRARSPRLSAHVRGETEGPGARLPGRPQAAARPARHAARRERRQGMSAAVGQWERARREARHGLPATRNAEACRRRREKLAAAGLCIFCGGGPGAPLCCSCRETQSEQTRERYRVAVEAFAARSVRPYRRKGSDEAARRLPANDERRTQDERTTRPDEAPGNRSARQGLPARKGREAGSVKRRRPNQPHRGGSLWRLALFLVTSFGEGQDTGAQPPRHIIG